MPVASAPLLLVDISPIITLIISLTVDDAATMTKLFSANELVAVTKIRSLLRTPVAPVQFAASTPMPLVDAVIEVFAMVQNPETSPAITLEFPPVPTEILVEAVRAPLTIRVPVAVEEAPAIKLPVKLDNPTRVEAPSTLKVE